MKSTFFQHRRVYRPVLKQIVARLLERVPEPHDKAKTEWAFRLAWKLLRDQENK